MFTNINKYVIIYLESWGIIWDLEDIVSIIMAS